jgi:hypothetical protein
VGHLGHIRAQVDKLRNGEALPFVPSQLRAKHCINCVATIHCPYKTGQHSTLRLYDGGADWPKSHA